jgi:transaldolase
MTDRLKQLSDAGVSIWLDDLSRERLVTGNLADLVANYHVVGVTSNPSIFQSALSHGEWYDAQIRELAGLGTGRDQAVRVITTDDVRDACKVMRPAYDASDHMDGRVSIEVSPGLAHDTDGTVAEAADLWKTVDQPNLMIKIPGTVEGGPAITETLAAGISVNVTLIFGLDQYRNVMDAHMAGLEKARENGHDLSTIHSVASFFVSRVDTEIDRRLDESGADASLKGRAGVANARLAYQAYEETLASDRWAALEAAGARRQRPLWASTGVKNPDYKDTLYVDDLIVEDTVNTMPEKTMHAEADHGDPKPDQVRPFYGEAAATMKALADAGIDYDDVIEVLIKEGVDKFIKAWGELLDSVDEALAAAQ